MENTNTPEKKYIVSLAKQGETQVWDSDTYERSKAGLYEKFPEADVCEVIDYDGNAADDDQFIVNLPDKGEVDVWDGATLNRSKESLLQKFPNAEIYKATKVDFFGHQLSDLERQQSDLRRKRAELEEQDRREAEDYIKAADPKGVADGEMREALEAAADGNHERKDAIKAIDDELNNIGKQIFYNPAYQKREALEAQNIQDSFHRIGAMMDTLEANNPEAQQMQNKTTSFVSSLNPNREEIIHSGKVLDKIDNPEYYRDQAALNAAKLYYEDAYKVQTAPSRYDDSKTGVGNFFRGLAGEAPETLSPIALAKALGEGAPLIDVVKQIQEVEGKDANIIDLVYKQPEKLAYLSDAQKELLKAFCVKSATDWSRSEDMSLGYQSGATAMQSLGFMADFIMTGGVGTKAAVGATKGLTKAIAKKSLDLGLKGAKREAVLAPAKFFDGTVQAVVKTAAMTPLMPSSYSNFVEGLATLDPNSGSVDLSGKAIINKVGDVLIENFSESAGTQVEGILSSPFKVASRAGFGDVLAGTKFGDWAKAMSKTPVSRIMRQAGWNGYIGEIGEEWYGNALRVMTGVDKDALKDFATVDQQIITLTSFAPMAIFGGGVSMAQYGLAKKDLSDASKNIMDTLTADGGYPKDEVAAYTDITSGLNSPKEIAQRFAPVITQAAKDNLQALPRIYKAVMDYAQAVARYRAFGGVIEADTEGRRQEMLDEINQRAGRDVVRTKRAEIADGSTINLQSIRAIEDQSGATRFVVGEDETQYATIDRDGNASFIGKADLEKGIADKTMTDTREMRLDDFLDREIARKAASDQRTRMDTEISDQLADVKSKVGVGSMLDLGTMEQPKMWTVVRATPDGVVLIDPQNDSGPVETRTWEEVAAMLGQPITSQTDEERERQDVAVLEEKKKLHDRLKGVPAGGTLAVNVDNGQGPIALGMTYTGQALLNDEGELMIGVRDGAGNEQFVPVSQVTTESLNEMISQAEAQTQTPASQETPAEESSTQPAATEEQQPEDDTRDFRGNPLPTKTVDGETVVDEATLWNNDPEAWARWNDKQRGDDGANSVGLITAAIASVNNTIAAAQQEYATTLDFDNRRTLEQTISAQQQRLATLQGLLDGYVQRETEAKAEKEAEKARAEEEARKLEEQAKEDAERKRKELAEHASSLQAHFDKMSDVPTFVVTEENVAEVMRSNGATERAINSVLENLEDIYLDWLHTGIRRAINGFHFGGKIYIFAESNVDEKAAEVTYYHERQHAINKQSPEAMNAVMALFNGDKNALLDTLKKIIGDVWAYRKAGAEELADEIVAFTMERAYTNPRFAEELRASGISDELINIITAEYGRQQNVQIRDRRSGERSSYDDERGQAIHRPDGQGDGRESGDEQMGGVPSGIADEDSGSGQEEGAGAEEGSSGLISEATAKELADKGLVMDGGVVMAAPLADLKRETGYLTPNERNTDLDQVNFNVRTLPGWRENYRKYPDSEERIVRALENLAERLTADELVSGVISQGDYGKNDKKGSGRFAGPLLTNIEYVVTFDMDTTCPRTFQYLNYVKQIEKRIGRPLTQRECVQLTEMMRVYGQQIPCVYCYSENKRQALKQYYTDYMTARQAVISAETDEEALKHMYGHATSKAAKNSKDPKVALASAAYKVFVDWRTNRGHGYNPSLKMLWQQFANDRNAILTVLDQLAASGRITVGAKDEKIAQAVGKELAISDKLAMKVVEDIVSEWKWDTIESREHSDFTPLDEDDIMVDQRTLSLWREMTAYAKSASQAKNVLRYVPYTDELSRLSQKDKDYINGMGGLRMHSSNDFRIDYVFDYFQFMADLAAEHMFGHTYTKSPEFVRIFGRSGYKINMSIAAYEDENGNIRMNEDEGFNWDEAKRLRETYPNAGIMLMATSDNQVQMALDSDWIDMFIPFHASSLPKAVWYDMRAWKDYTTSQNETFLNGEEMKAALLADGVAVPKGIRSSDVEQMYIEHFNIKTIYDKDGKRLRPHFLPGETKVNGQEVPGHHNDHQEYLRLCREWGVHPRFYGIKVRDNTPEGGGRIVDISEHPAYIKCVKETARTDTPQTAIQFNFDQPDEFLDGRTPMEYAFSELEARAAAESEAAGQPVRDIYKSLEKDPYGIVPQFINTIIKHKEETGKDYPWDYITPDSRKWFLTERRAIEEAYKDVTTIPYHRKEYDENGKEIKPQPQTESAIDTINETVFGKDGGEMDEEQQVSFRIVDNPEQIAKLDSEETISVYQSAVKIGDNYYPPMATLSDTDENGRPKLGQPVQFGSWIESEEHPERIPTSGKNKGKYPLKQKGKVTWVAYNPYLHTTASPLNDQFTSAHNKDLVVLEVQIPKSELTSGYHADMAKDSTGEMSWHSGPVSGELAKLGRERKVILTRWAKPIREVPTEEIADKIAEMLDGTGIAIPINVVTPDLRNALAERGVQFGQISGIVGKTEKAALEKELERINETQKNSEAATQEEQKNTSDITFDDIAKMVSEGVKSRHIAKINAGQKRADGKYVDSSEMEEDVQFRISNNNRKTIEGWLDKWAEAQTGRNAQMMKQVALDYLDDLDDATTQLAWAKWFCAGKVRLGDEDMPKVEQAIVVAKRHKVDPLTYDSPMEIINQFPNEKIKEKPINPDTISTLHRAKEFPDDGIVIYDVDDTQESRENMRKIINTHFGKSCSPWCLLQGDGKGNLTKDSANYWEHYSAYPKQVAFRNGKLLAFSANDSRTRIWWDRIDQSHKGIPITEKVPGDTFGRIGTIDISPTTGKKGKYYYDLHRGNEQNGRYEIWESLEGNNDIYSVYNYKNGVLDGLSATYQKGAEGIWKITSATLYENGEKLFRKEYREGKVSSRELYDQYGRLYEGFKVQYYDSDYIDRVQLLNDKDYLVLSAWSGSHGDIAYQTETGRYLKFLYNPDDKTLFFETKLKSGDQVRQEWHLGGRHTCIYNFGHWENGELPVETLKKIFNLYNIPSDPTVDNLVEYFTEEAYSLLERGDALEEFMPEVTIHTTLTDEEIASGQLEEPNFRVSTYTDEEQSIIDNAKADGTYMKAPNGEQTKLNEKQWAQVRTAAFKEWFGDWENEPENASKVVDENGEPRVVYHQTNSTIWVNRKTGQNFDDLDWEDKNYWQDEASQEEWEENWEEQDFYTFDNKNHGRTAVEMPAFFFSPNYDENHEYGERTIEAFLSIKNPAINPDIENAGRYDDAGEKAMQKLIEQGYDGFIREYDGALDEVNAFYPNQIKSATENNGDFSSENDDIRYRVSSARDNEYAQAVEAGDAKKVAKMVKAAAKESMPDTKVVDAKGNPKLVYHGTTSKEEFYVFGDGYIFLSSKRGVADSYTHVRRTFSVDPAQSGRIMPCYVNLENPLIVDGHYRGWNNIKVDWSEETLDTEQIADYAKENGFDGVIVKNVKDNMFDDDKTVSDDIIAFDSSQVKSAGPSYSRERKDTFPWDERDVLTNEVGATYDDNGNLIPLSQRFNLNEEDIRYRTTAVGGNSGYVGYSMSRRAAEAREEGRFPKTDFKKEYGLKSGTFDALVDAGVISDNEWHHTSKYGNRTTFYGWAGERYAQSYTDNKEAVDALAKQYNADAKALEVDTESNPYVYMQPSEEYLDAQNKIWSEANAEGDRLDAENLDNQKWQEELERVRKTRDERLAALRAEASEADKAILENNDKRIEYETEQAAKADEARKQKRTLAKQFRSDLEQYFPSEEGVSLRVTESTDPADYRESLAGRRAAAEEMGRTLGVDVQMVSRSELPEGHENALGVWRDGKVLICAENNPSADEARRTVLHEAVGHNGLRRLVGNENMDSLCMEVYRLADEQTRSEIIALASRHGYDFAEATEEWLASQAETMDFSSGWNEFWTSVREALADLLRKAGFNVRLGRRDMQWLLWQSYNANRQGDLLNEASRAYVANRLGFSEAALNERAEAREEIRFRVVDRIAERSAAAAYNRAVNDWRNRFTETYTDQYQSVCDLVEAIEKKSGSKAKGFEDVRLALNQQSSKGLAAIQKWTRECYNPMMDAVRKIMKVTHISLADVERYVMLKHALERNRVFAKRDAIRDYEAIRDEKLREIENHDEWDDSVKQSARNRVLREHDAHLSAIDAEIDSKYLEYREKDYGGLTALYSTQDDSIKESDYDTREEYLQARRDAVHQMFGSVADMEAAAADEVQSYEDLMDRYSWYDLADDLWKAINAATKATLKHQYDANMLSKEQYEYISTMFEYYVPLRGFAETEAEDLYDYWQESGRGGFTAPIQAARGRKTQAESPFGYIGAMASSAIAADMKNESKLALYFFLRNRRDAAQDLVTMSESWYEKISDTEVEQVYYPYTEGLSTEEAKAAYDAWVEMMELKAKSGLAFKGQAAFKLGYVIHISDRNAPEHAIRVKVRGKDFTMYINGNPRAAQAINGDLNIERTDDYRKIFGKILRWFSSINTSWNPEFWISNMQRDLLFSLMAVNVKEDSEYNKAFRKNLRKTLHTLLPGSKKGVRSMMRRLEKGTLDSFGGRRLDNMYQEFVENGGVTGYTVIRDNEEWETEAKKYTGEKKAFIKALASVGSTIQSFGEAIEQMTRFAAFVTSREMGKDINSAIADAKELTVNFNRKGSGKAITFDEAKKLTDKDGKPLNWAQQKAVVMLSWLPVYGRRFIMFFNAAQQGLNAMWKLAKKNPAKLGLWTAGYFALGVINAVVHSMLDDDDDYLDIPDYERRNNLLLGGNGVYFKWAMPQEARAFYAMGDMAYNHIAGRTPNKKLVWEASSAMLDVLPLNPAGGASALIPSAAVPFFEAGLPFDLFKWEGVNRDYKGSKIWNDMKYLSDEQRKRIPDYQKAFDGTGKLYIDFAKMMNEISGGDYADAGAININPARVEHYVEGFGGGALTTVNKIIKSTVGQAWGEDFQVRTTPFLSRLLTIPDERYRNAHITELYNYYKAEADDFKYRYNKYRKAGDKEKIQELVDSEDYTIYKAYQHYRKVLERYNDLLKLTDDKDEKRELMREQDEYRKKMINEISGK